VAQTNSAGGWLLRSHPPFLNLGIENPLTTRATSGDFSKSKTSRPELALATRRPPAASTFPAALRKPLVVVHQPDVWFACPGRISLRPVEKELTPCP
jgi:hypothetical protein